MIKEINKKLDRIQSTLSDIRVSQARTEEKVEAAIKVQEKHEKELNCPDGKVGKVENEVDHLKKDLNSIKIYLGLIATGITLVINIGIDWFMNFFKGN